MKTHFLADAVQVNLSIAALNTRLGFFQIAEFETFQGFPPLRLTMQTNTSALKRLEHKLSKRGAGCRFREGQKVGQIWWWIFNDFLWSVMIIIGFLQVQRDEPWAVDQRRSILNAILDKWKLSWLWALVYLILWMLSKCMHIVPMQVCQSRWLGAKVWWWWGGQPHLYSQVRQPFPCHCRGYCHCRRKNDDLRTGVPGLAMSRSMGDGCLKKWAKSNLLGSRS